MDDKYKVVFRGHLAPTLTEGSVKKNLVRLFKASEAHIEKILSDPPVDLKINLDRQSALKYQAVLKKAGLVCLLERMKASPGQSRKEKNSKEKSQRFHKSPNKKPETFDVVFDGKIVEGFDLYTVKQNLAKSFKTDFKKIHELLAPRPALVKQGTDYGTAQKIKATLKEAGARCRIVAGGSVEPGEPDVGLFPLVQTENDGVSSSDQGRKSSSNSSEMFSGKAESETARQLPTIESEARKTAPRGRKSAYIIAAFSLIAICIVFVLIPSFLQRPEKPESGVRSLRRKIESPKPAPKSKSDDIDVIEKAGPPPDVVRETLITLEEVIAMQFVPSDYETVAKLDASGSAAQNLEPLRKLPNLQSLDLSSAKVSDISVLSELPELRSLDLSSTTVSDIGPLSGLTELEELDLRNTPVSDLAPLTDLPGLRRLRVTGTQVSEFRPLAGVSSLEYLEAGQGRISGESMIELKTALPDLDIVQVAGVEE